MANWNGLAKEAINTKTINSCKKALDGVRKAQIDFFMTNIHKVLRLHLHSSGHVFKTSPWWTCLTGSLPVAAAPGKLPGKLSST